MVEKDQQPLHEIPKLGNNNPFEGLQPSRSPRLKARQAKTERKESESAAGFEKNFPHHATVQANTSGKSPLTAALPAVASRGSRALLVSGDSPRNIWQTLARLNECCSHDVEHPRIFETDYDIRTFFFLLMIDYRIEKKKVPLKP